jgi:putative tryptophan/tyrosine transport system substrate-binding protein
MEFDQLKRREFITLVGGAAVLLPHAARAQQQGVPVIGFLSARSPAESASDLAAFRQGLGQTGYFEGKNVAIEYRWAEGRYDRLPALAAELAARQIAVIAAVGGEPSGLAAKAATGTIPIVCTLGGDAVAAGLVAHLNRPGGNITGVTIMGLEMGPKRVELAHQLVPNGSALATLVNSKFPPTLAEAHDMQAAAHSLGLQLTVLDASTEGEIDAVFAGLAPQKVDALLINTDPFLFGQREQIIQLAARYKIPTLYFFARVRRCRGPNELWTEYQQRLSTGGDLRRSHSKRREGWRIASRAADQVRSGDQFVRRQDARSRNPDNPARPRRRGDRISLASHTNCFICSRPIM